MTAVLQQWEQGEKSRENEEVKVAATVFLVHVGIKNKTYLNH